MRTAMTWNDATRVLSIQLAPGARMLPPARRAIEVRVAGQTATRSVMFEGKPVDVRF